MAFTAAGMTEEEIVKQEVVAGCPIMETFTESPMNCGHWSTTKCKLDKCWLYQIWKAVTKSPRSYSKEEC